MPTCAGRPESGRCPNNKSDSTVKWSICDLFLCQDCYDYRIPTPPLSDNGSAGKPKQSTPETGPVRNELLCFIQQKGGVMAADHLVKLCTDFYRSDEVVAARSAIEQFVQHRMTKRQGADGARKSLEDLVKLCVDPNVQLPVFYATDLSRLPPVDASHCDVSALLREIQALRAEVREITELKSELEQLKSAVRGVPSLMKEVQALRAEVNATAVLRQEVDSLQKRLIGTKQIDSHWPRLTDTPVMPTLVAGQAMPVTSFATIAGELMRSANSGEQLFEMKSKNKTSHRTQLICGKASGQTRMAVDGMRRAHIFMSRFCPETTTDDVISLTNNVLTNCADVKVEKLKTRFDTYASFNVEICVTRSNFDDLIANIYSAETWPEGILVRRFYRNKNGDKQ